MNKMRTNDVLRNMVTGAEVTITAIDGDKITFNDGTVLDTKKVEACFKFVGNESPYPVPTAEVNGGNVIIDGAKIVTGIMKPIKTVVTVPGAALILIEGKDGKMNLVRFDAVTGEFNKNAIAEGIDDVNVIYNKDDTIIYSVVTKNDRKVVDEEDDEKTAVVKDYADRVFVLKAGDVIGQFYNLAINKFVDAIVADDGQVQIFFERSKKLETKEDIDGYEFNVVEDMDGVDLVEIAIVEEVDEDTDEVIDVYANTYCSHYGNVVKVSQIHGDNGVLVVTSNGIHIYGRRHMAIGQDVTDAVAKFPILARFTAASGSHDHDTFILANEKYESVAIRVKRVGGPVGYTTEITEE